MSQSIYPKRKAWCYTDVRNAQYEFTWIIDNFSSFWSIPTTLVKSSIFSTKTSDNKLSEWCLHLTPKYSNTDFISIHICLTSTEQAKIYVKLSFYLLDDTGMMKCVNSTGNETFCFNLQCPTFGYPHFVKKDALLSKDNRLLTGDKLTVVCEMTIIEEEPINISGTLEANIKHPPSVKLSEDYSKLFEDGTLSDVTLVADGKKFLAHKVVLSARSAVFAAMFEHEMAETTKNLVEISDIDHDVLLEMLRYIYTGNTGKLQQMPGELYSAAEKYALEELKHMCDDAMRSGLSATTAAQILVLADLHDAKKLKAQAMDFINAHLLEVMATAEFKSVLATNPDLLADVLASVATQKLFV